MNKYFSIVGLSLITASQVFAQNDKNNNESFGSPTTSNTTDTTKNGGKAYTNQTTTPYNQHQPKGVNPGTGAASGNLNYTGTTIYNNGTGTNVPQKSTTNDSSHSLDVQQYQNWQEPRILKFAVESGAYNPRIENGTLIFYGDQFNQQKFLHLLKKYDSSISVQTETH